MKSLDFILRENLNEKLRTVTVCSGGSIADSKEVLCESGNRFFVKTYGSPQIVRNEVNGLKELAKAEVIKIPEIIYYDNHYLILEYIDSKGRSENFSEDFGSKLAALHRVTSDKFGFYEDNYIGSIQQVNSMKENWTDFFIENRLKFQFRLMDRKGYSDNSFRKLFSDFINRVPRLISGTEEKPSLLHGDLWRGNYMVDSNGYACLIDPAVYYGHREAELAMTKLFGGFDSKFYDAYDEAFPLKDNWQSRMDLYMLYHVMNHLNIFGESYLSQVKSIIKSYI